LYHEGLKTGILFLDYCRTNRGETAVVLACRAYQEHPEMIPLLAQYGASLNVRDQYGTEMLTLAASHGHAAAVEALLQFGCPVDGAPGTLLTPLQAAAREGRSAVVDILITHGADLDRQGDGGSESPLLESLLKHDNEIAKRLIEAGADVRQGGMSGAPPLHYALGRFDDWVYERSRPPKVNRSLIELLLEKGADPSEPLGLSPTALDLARKTRNTQLIGLIKAYLRRSKGLEATTSVLPPSYQ
ncbi:ankyrin repeat domain-containing protein, partial [Candidatus Entotheonella palauensis]|uniref:ankyrin repeat domain-containing protein n=1 Tax=Candidatus Entotheonella palauensis TaxID=93172 RepID=UPI001C4E187D